MVWGGISIKGLIGCHSFKTIVGGSYYIQILQDHLIPNAKRQFSRRWRLKWGNHLTHKSRLSQQLMSSEIAEVIDWP